MLAICSNYSGRQRSCKCQVHLHSSVASDKILVPQGRRCSTWLLDWRWAIYWTQLVKVLEHNQKHWHFSSKASCLNLIFPISIDFLWFRYMPILPMVLVNGSEGIGTGWSSYIPNYNPRELVANLKHLLNGEPTHPMDPWYKGFKVMFLQPFS